MTTNGSTGGSTPASTGVLPQRDEALGWVGRTVVDPSGTEVGECRQVFADDDSGAVEWLGVEVDGVGRAVVPALGVTAEGDRVRVPHARAVVLTAPVVGQAEHVDAEHERRLYEHYGVEASTAESRTLLPEEGQQVGAASGGTAAGAAGAAGGTSAGGTGGADDYEPGHAPALERDDAAALAGGDAPALEAGPVEDDALLPVPTALTAADAATRGDVEGPPTEGAPRYPSASGRPSRGAAVTAGGGTALLVLLWALWRGLRRR